MLVWRTYTCWVGRILRVGRLYGTVLKNIWSWFNSYLKWHFRDGAKILIGHSRLWGSTNPNPLSNEIIKQLNVKCYFYLAQIIKEKINGSPGWTSADNLNFLDHLKEEWNEYDEDLRSHGFLIDIGGDRVIWKGPTRNEFSIVRDI